MKRSYSAGRIIALIFLVGPIAVFIFGILVMWLWNNALVPVFHISKVTFWQGLGILVLSKILFSSFGGGDKSGHERRKQRMMWNNMTPEQKEKFKEEWRNRSRRWGNRSCEPEKGDEEVFTGS